MSKFEDDVIKYGSKYKNYRNLSTRSKYQYYYGPYDTKSLAISPSRFPDINDNKVNLKQLLQEENYMKFDE